MLLFNKTLSLISLAILMLHTSCGQVKNNTTTNMNQEFAHTNALINESSPYLLQHAHNPVNWYPWGPEALQKAKDENKLIIISIGYAACHWCHVMEHESFEDTAVARIMNDNFIAIKVDREERPDVDQVYMTAAQLITGSGGWPLNALALPDGRPFYAGTYFPKNKWINMLEYFVDMQKKDPAAIRKSAEQITQGIHVVENVTFKDVEKTFSVADLDKQFASMKAGLDMKKGGPDRAPKFPMPCNWEYVLHYYYLSKNADALKTLNLTLSNMTWGGIYDQLGGGFARYSTDKDWHVPHFEKMLYDNAQLVSLYAKAYQLTKDPLYKETVYETLEFIAKELTSPEGGFYSSLDADSEGEEGKYYVWSKKELNEILGADAKLFNEYYNISENGNWEHDKNILFRKGDESKLTEKFGITSDELGFRIKQCKAKLMQVREKRVKPGLDDKILSSWNALMLRGYAQAYRAFNDDRFLKAALKNAEFLLQQAIAESGEMTRNYKNGKSSINGMLDDYAFTISAFIELYQATFDEKWLKEAKKICDYATAHFFDKKSGMYFYTHNKYADLIARKMEVADNVIPSSNSEMAKNLFLLGNFYADDEMIKTAKQMLINVEEDVNRNIYFYANWGVLQAFFSSPLYEAAITGADYIQKRKEFDENYLPNVIYLGTQSKSNLALLENKLVPDETVIYVCRNKSCKLPVKEVRKALEQIANY